MATGTPPAPAPAESPDLAQILAALQDLTQKVEAKDAQIEALTAQVERAKAATPRIVRRPGDDPHNVESRRARVTAGMKTGESRGGGEQLPIDAHGKRIPTELLDRYGPKYEAGDEVRIRRDVARDGFPGGQTWGDVLDKQRCAGVGVVLRQSFLTKLGEWKYVCHFPGLTRRERGDGFYDSEIEPAA